MRVGSAAPSFLLAAVAVASGPACHGPAARREPRDGDVPRTPVDAQGAATRDDAGAPGAGERATIDGASAGTPWPAAVPPVGQRPDGFRSFRAGPRRTGRANARVPRAPELRWTYGAGGAIRAQPVVAADGSVIVASFDGTVAAVGPDGRRRWSFAAGDRIYSTPAIDGEGVVYFGADGGSLYALEAGGRSRWTILPADETGKPELQDVDTAPVLGDGAGFVGAGPYVYAFDLRGAIRWRTATGGKVFSSPALLPDGTVVVGSQDDKLWALRSGGAVRWTYPTAADVDGSPAVDEARQVVYVGGDDRKVHAVSFEGRARWTTDVGGVVRSGIAVDADGWVYVTTFGPTARLAALDPDGGWIRWTVDAGTGPTAEFGIRSSPVVDPDGVVLFGAPGGFVRAVSREGEVLWTFAAPDDVDAGPILADDGTVYFGCDDGALRALGDRPPESRTPAPQGLGAPGAEHPEPRG